MQGGTPFHSAQSWDQQDELPQEQRALPNTQRAEGAALGQQYFLSSSHLNKENHQNS